MNSMIFLVRRTGIIEDLGTLLLFLSEENFSEEPTYVFFKKNGLKSRILLDNFGLCFYEKGIRKPFEYQKDTVFFVETDAEKELRLSVASIALRF